MTVEEQDALILSIGTRKGHKIYIQFLCFHLVIVLRNTISETTDVGLFFTQINPRSVVNNVNNINSFVKDRILDLHE